MLAIGDVIHDRFRIESTIGRGGMGVVYRAHDQETGKAVAVKVLTLPPGDSQLRFRREFRVMSRLDHPRVVPVIESGVHNNANYLVMQMLNGGTLEQAFAGAVLDADGLADRLRMLAEIADALTYVHGQGIVHRDLKPENVLLDENLPHLMDFGLAKSAQQATIALTQVGQLLGTVAYMSPEQARGQAVDGRSDLYAFGCMLYRAIVGQPPFAGDSYVEVLLKQIRESAPPPSREVPFVPPRLDRLVLRLLEKAPADRVSSAAEVAIELRAIIAQLKGTEAPPADLQKDALEEADDTPAQLLRPPLIGRDKLWSRLLSTLDPSSTERAIVLEGSPGIGATRLLDEFALEARSRRAIVLRIRNPEGSGNLPYDGWKRALARLHAAEPTSFLEAAQGLEAQLTWLLPAVFPGVEGPNLPPDVAQLRLYDAIDQLVSHLGRQHPDGMAVLVDDLHEADEGSINLVSYLSRGAAAGPVAMAVAVHPEAIGRSGQAILRQLEAARVVLEPLAEDDARTLVAATLGGVVDEQLERHVARRSGGNPFFIQELLGALLRSRRIRRRSGIWSWNRALADLPPSIETIFAQRIEALENRARTTAAAASAIGPVFDFDLLLALIDADEDDLLDDLDELLRAKFIDEMQRDRYRFTHPLLRDTLHARLPARRRRRYHERLAELLAQRPDTPPAALAEHHAETDDPGAATPYALAAARNAERVFANDIAERYYRLALEVMSPEAVARAEVELALGRLLDRIGRWEEAKDLLTRASASAHVRVPALMALGTYASARGELVASEGYLRSALESAPDDAATRRQLGVTLLARGAFKAARDEFHESLALAMAGGEASAGDVALTQTELGSYEYNMGQKDAALAWFATAQAHPSTAEQPLLQARIALRIGWIHYQTGALDEATAAFEWAHERFQEAGDVANTMTALYALGMVLETLGDFDRTSEVMATVRSQAHRYGDSKTEVKAKATLGWVLQRLGRYDEAVEQLRAAFNYFSAQGFRPIAHQVQTNLAVVLARQGREAEARQALAAAESMAGDDATDSMSAITTLARSEVLLREGDGRGATASLTPAIAAFAELGSQQEHLEAALLQAEACMLLGDAAGMDDALAGVETMASTLTDPFWRQQMAYLRALQADDDAARLVIEADAEEDGLLPYVQLVQRTLRRAAKRS